MKRFSIFAAVCAFALTAFQSVRADVSVNFFYDNLNGGNWYQVADYGYVWQPDAATSADWRPYTDGYWAYTDVGWTWVSYEDFGWATYHYGRWVRLEDYGWCWVPGYEWGPAWVSWRTGGNYVGWAPLPPDGGGEIVYESRPITSRVDVDFDIGPGYYNFIDVRFIGEPVLRGHFYPYDQNVVYINNTVNVTNITYNNSVVYNYGPDYALVSRYSTRPIPRLKLERANLDPLQAVKAGSVTKVQGDKLVLAAPLKLQKSNTQIAPKVVKAKIDQPRVEKGWANISDPNAKAKLEQKLKTENPKNVPPPSNQPNAAANVNALASPGVSPFGKGKGKNKDEAFQNQPGGSITPVEQGQGKKGKGHRFESEELRLEANMEKDRDKQQALLKQADQLRDKPNNLRKQKASGVSGGTGVAPGTSPSQAFEQGQGKHKGQKFENEPGASATSPTQSFEQSRGKLKGQKFENKPGASTPPASSPKESFGQGQGKHKGQRLENTPVAPSSSEFVEQGKGKKNKGRVEQGEQTPFPGRPIPPRNPNADPVNQNNPESGKHTGNLHEESFQPGSQNVGGGGAGGKRREQIQSQGPPPQGGQNGQQSEQQGGQSKGKGKKGETSPTPSPR